MISVDLSKCTGCRRCEIACVFFHTGKVGSHLSRIKVVHAYETGIDGPVVCVQCTEQYCLPCPADALSIGSSGEIVYNSSECVQCGTCETRCPIGAIELFEGAVYVCDLCKGEPKCVNACTEGAITYQPEGEHTSLQEFREQASKMNPSQKRYSYIREKGEEIREKWREFHG